MLASVQADVKDVVSSGACCNTKQWCASRSKQWDPIRQAAECWSSSSSSSEEPAAAAKAVVTISPPPQLARAAAANRGRPAVEALAPPEWWRLSTVRHSHLNCSQQDERRSVTTGSFCRPVSGGRMLCARLRTQMSWQHTCTNLLHSQLNLMLVCEAQLPGRAICSILHHSQGLHPLRQLQMRLLNCKGGRTSADSHAV